MNTPSPFHSGEREAQALAGARGVDSWARRAIRPLMPEQHRAFYAGLSFAVLAARDEAGRPWATIVAGEPGFLSAPAANTLRSNARPGPGDALEGALAQGSDVGLLGIDLATRRRNRANGRVVATDGSGFVLGVEQSFGNCPQYIHERAWERSPSRPQPARRTRTLTPEQRARIDAADTFFLATGHRGEGEHESFGMDASHRGGEPGFVRAPDPSRVVYTDFAGNQLFNSIGNLLRDARAGMLFVDFRTGSMLQLTGRATVTWGATRVVTLAIDEVIELPDALPLRWAGDAHALRSLLVRERVRESDDVTSFVLVARDGGPLAPFTAGQHLPIELDLGPHAGRVSRSYSLSNAPSDEHYRITVKRHDRGLVSRLLHEHLDEGSELQARAPAGSFTLAHDDAPVVLVSAGVGLTPMVSMLHSLVNEGPARDVFFVHGARDMAHHSLAREVRALAAKSPRVRVHVAYSAPRPGDRGHDATGRLDGALIARAVSRPEARYYLCGPLAFVASMRAQLEGAGVDPTRIESEDFAA